MKINGLLISSGLSERMGEPKPLLMYENLPFAVGIIKKLSQVCEKIIVVIGHEGETVRTNVEKYLNDPQFSLSELAGRVEFVDNPNYTEGMFTSLQSGLKAIGDAEWAIYHFVDQPGLPESFYIDFAAQKDFTIDWIQPVYREQKGHPILINNTLFKTIIDSPPNISLRELASSIKVKKKFWKCEYPEILEDIDTIEDYLESNKKLPEEFVDPEAPPPDQQE
ncbi:MAG: hypothetical protein A2V66_04060 [Ignavibacteria bacterium RBG_13_36_8]|nr:MAG: hypothetical protein A2V66_04060 [Ignavibacteria bacterium RBG_13_36_8]